MALKPEPVNKHIVCSVCGLDWVRHEAKQDKAPSLEKCVELLKADLSKSFGRQGIFNMSGTTTATPLPQNWNTL